MLTNLVRGAVGQLHRKSGGGQTAGKLAKCAIPLKTFHCWAES